jgi:ribosomal protein L7/L12
MDLRDFVMGLPDDLFVEVGIAVDARRIAAAPSEPTYGEISLWRAGGEVAAVKAYRVRTGRGLKESLDAVRAAGGSAR